MRMTTPLSSSPSSMLAKRLNAATRVMAIICSILLCTGIRTARAAAHHGEGHNSAAGAGSMPANLSSIAQPVPLPLPVDSGVACSNKVFNEFTTLYRSCSYAAYNQKNPDELCCRGLADYFGINSTKPSKNCFCAPKVWARLNARKDYHRIKFKQTFQYCRLKYGNVIAFFQPPGLGYCNGTQDDKVKMSAIDADYVMIMSSPAFSNWASRLHKDWLMTVAFISSIISAPGFFIFLWPFAYDLVMLGLTSAKLATTSFNKQRF